MVSLNKVHKAAIIVAVVFCLVLCVSVISSDLSVNFLCGQLFGSLGVVFWTAWASKGDA